MVELDLIVYNLLVPLIVAKLWEGSWWLIVTFGCCNLKSSFSFALSCLV